MTFTDGYRVERVYFERLKSLITILKSLKDGVEDETVRTLIENAIDSDGAILLLYRNLGEAWAELADQVQKTRKMLQDLDEKTEKYHDELNERIDEVNNYLMALIRALEARMDAVEADLAQMGRLFTYDLQRVNDEYTLTESGQPVTWAGTKEKVEHVRPHFVTVRGTLDGEVTYLMPREYDTQLASGIFEWYSVGFVRNEIHEVTVTLLPDDSVNVEIKTTDFAAILQRITALETRMTTAESDIDNLETEMDGKQDALTPGTGIDITGNVISADTDVLQEKLVAGSGISIDPVTKEITNTAQGEIYTPGKDILIENKSIINNLGLRNLGTLTKIIERLDANNNIVYSNTLPYPFFSKTVLIPVNAKGLLISFGVLKIFSTNSDASIISSLEQFESDFELGVNAAISITNKNNFVRPVTGYFNRNISTKLICENNVLKNKVAYDITNNSFARYVLNDTIIEYIPLAKYNNKDLYVSYTLWFNPIKTSKPVTDWVNFLNTINASDFQSSFTGPVFSCE